MEQLPQQIVNGLWQGGALALFALGYTLVFGSLDIVNLAHGAFYALGAYAAASLTGAWFAAGYPPMLSYVVLLAAAMLFPPWAAMAIAGIGSIDPREMRREIKLHHALFNRAQTMIAVGAGALVFTPVRGDIEPVDFSALFLFATVATALVYTSVNLGLVSIWVALRQKLSPLDEQWVLAFTAAASILTGILCGIVPAILLTGAVTWLSPFMRASVPNPRRSCNGMTAVFATEASTQRMKSQWISLPSVFR